MCFFLISNFRSIKGFKWPKTQNYLLNILLGYVVLHNSTARRERPTTLIYVFLTQSLCLSRNRLFYIYILVKSI